MHAPRPPPPAAPLAAAPSPPIPAPSRRALLAAAPLLAAASCSLTPLPAAAAPRGYAAYVRKRSLGPIETYVPPLLAARAQLEGVEALIGRKRKKGGWREMARAATASHRSTNHFLFHCP